MVFARRARSKGGADRGGGLQEHRGGVAREPLTEEPVERLGGYGRLRGTEFLVQAGSEHPVLHLVSRDRRVAREPGRLPAVSAGEGGFWRRHSAGTSPLGERCRERFAHAGELRGPAERVVVDDHVQAKGTARVAVSNLGVTDQTGR